MPTFEIKNRWTAAVIFSLDCGSLKVCVEAAVTAGVSLRAADLRAADLRAADLRAADLSAADLRAADLRAADLRAADLRAADLSAANLRAADLSEADLSAANLRAANLSEANFSEANLRGADFSEADLSEANLRAADLREANLRAADLSDFAVPSLHRKILAAIESGGTFDMARWHGPKDEVCGTTHCRGGWSINLAGAVGRTLEYCLGTNAAAALIHIASCPALEGKVPNFTDTNENALADIKRLAALEPELTA